MPVLGVIGKSDVSDLPLQETELGNIRVGPSVARPENPVDFLDLRVDPEDDTKGPAAIELARNRF